MDSQSNNMKGRHPNEDPPPKVVNMSFLGNFFHYTTGFIFFIGVFLVVLLILEGLQWMLKLLQRKCGAKHCRVEDELADQLDEAEVKDEENISLSDIEECLAHIVQEVRALKVENKKLKIKVEIIRGIQKNLLFVKDELERKLQIVSDCDRDIEEKYQYQSCRSLLHETIDC